MSSQNSLPKRDDNGKFPTYAWPGGYPIVYFCADGAILCPSCANLPEAHEGPGGEREWRLTGADALYEGRETCAHCEGEIVGAYEEKDQGEEADPPPCPYGEQWEHVRTWEAERFRLDLWTDYRPYNDGPQTRMAYRLKDGGEVIFEGNDFGCSPLHAVDSDECVNGILRFLSLRPGDTDPEFFADDTPRQKAWREERAEGLQLEAMQLCDD